MYYRGTLDFSESFQHERILKYMIRMVDTGNGKLSYELIVKKVKNINLRIKADGRVIVSAPSDLPPERADSFVIAKYSFIDRHLQRIREREKMRYMHDYMEGDIFPYLGRKLIFRIETGKRSEIYADGDELIAVIKDADGMRCEEKAEVCRRLVEKWYRKEAENLFGNLAAEVWEFFRPMGVSMPEISVRKMKSMWGSCRPESGRITMNLRLIEAPPSCIVYVMVHEFVHLICPHHQKSFYELQEKIIPDWKERKKLLEKSVILR